MLPKRIKTTENVEYTAIENGWPVKAGETGYYDEVHQVYIFDNPRHKHRHWIAPEWVRANFNEYFVEGA